MTDTESNTPGDEALEVDMYDHPTSQPDAGVEEVEPDKAEEQKDVAPAEDSIPDNEERDTTDTQGQEDASEKPYSYTYYEELDDKTQDEIVSFGKEHGLSEEVIQAFLDRSAQNATNVISKTLEAHSETVKGWANLAKNDKEYGGKKYGESVKLAREAVAKFGNEDVKKVFNEFGIGNHPEIIRMFVKVGRSLQSDKFAHAQSSTKEESTSSYEDIFYASSTAKKVR
jgi:beta-N-acetylglucosaminidase